MREFSIKFIGLSNGKHEFDFKINRKFFDELAYSTVESGDIDVLLEMDKSESMLILNFSIEGLVDTTCDHCATTFACPISSKNKLIVKVTNDDIEESDEIVTIGRDEYEIDVAQFIYEFISLAVPTRKTACKNEGNEEICDKEVIEQLEKLSGEKKSKNKEVDPRWEALQKIKLQK